MATVHYIHIETGCAVDNAASADEAKTRALAWFKKMIEENPNTLHLLVEKEEVIYEDEVDTEE